MVFSTCYHRVSEMVFSACYHRVIDMVFSTCYHRVIDIMVFCTPAKHLLHVLHLYDAKVCSGRL